MGHGCIRKLNGYIRKLGRLYIRKLDGCIWKVHNYIRKLVFGCIRKLDGCIRKLLFGNYEEQNQHYSYPPLFVAPPTHFTEYEEHSF